MKDSVLVVDDDDGIRGAVQLALEAEGVEALIASNGQEALDLLATCAPLPSLIILDLVMPVMNGWRFLDAVGKYPKLSRIPIIVFSASVEVEPLPSGILLLQKPIDLDALVEIVKKLCGGSPQSSMG